MLFYTLSRKGNSLAYVSTWWRRRPVVGRSGSLRERYSRQKQYRDELCQGISEVLLIVVPRLLSRL